MYTQLCVISDNWVRKHPQGHVEDLRENVLWWSSLWSWTWKIKNVCFAHTLLFLSYLIRISPKGVCVKWQYTEPVAGSHNRQNKRVQGKWVLWHAVWILTKRNRLRCYRLCGIIIYFFNLDLMSAQQVCQIFVRLKDLYKRPTWVQRPIKINKWNTWTVFREIIFCWPGKNPKVHRIFSLKLVDVNL